jgi:hypothetical protein
VHSQKLDRAAGLVKWVLELRKFWFSENEILWGKLFLYSIRSVTGEVK